MVKKKTQNGMSYETKTIIVVLTLLFVTPAGLILMWVWMKWPLWIKILLTVLPFLFVFLIFGFILAVLGIVFSNPDIQKEMRKNISTEMSQTEDDMSKIYTNKFLHYSFQYIPTWTLTSHGQENIEIQSPDFKARYNGASISITALPTKETSVEKELEKPQGGLAPENVQKVTVDGLEAVRMDNKWEARGTLTFFIKDGYFYNVQIVTYNDDDYKNNLPIYNRLLSTFKFTQ